MLIEILFTTRSKNTVNGRIYDDVFEVNLKDGTEKKITTGLVGTNYIVPMKDGIFHVSLDVKVNNNQLLPYFYDFSDESTTLLISPKDFTIRNISYNIYTNKIALTTYNEPEYYELMLQQAEVELVAPENRLLVYEDIFEEPIDLVTTPEKDVISIGLFQNRLESIDFNNFDDWQVDKKSTTTVDFTTKEVTYSDKVGFEELGAYVGTNKDETKLYFLNPIGSLGVYDFATQEIKWIFRSVEGSSRINNAIMLRKD